MPLRWFTCFLWDNWRLQLNWSQDMAPRLSEHHHGFQNDYYWVVLHGIYKRDVNSYNLGQMFGLQRPNNLLVQCVTGKLNWQIWFRKTISATSQRSLTNYVMFSVVLCMNILLTWRFQNYYNSYFAKNQY